MIDTQQDMLNSIPLGLVPLSGLTYQMFSISGQLGYYMLYNQLSVGEEPQIKGDRTLE